MFRLIHLFRTSIGRKLVMALSGVVLLLFVVGHLICNMTIFIGPTLLNSYAHWLQHSVMLWPFRFVMLFFVALHIVMGVTLARENQQTATVGSKGSNGFVWAIRKQQMVWSGTVVLLFLFFHLAHLTLGMVDAGELFSRLDSNQMADVYWRVVAGFQTPWITILYILLMGGVGLHLSHVVRGLLQTLGFYHENYLSLWRYLSWGLSGVVTLGFIAIPLAVVGGVVQ